jgi:hypothetical protein
MFAIVIDCVMDMDAFPSSGPPVDLKIHRNVKFQAHRSNDDLAGVKSGMGRKSR